jgi:UPF0716 protein FxsA
MFFKLMLLFIVVPIMEIYVLLEVGNTIGLAATILLVFATGVAGAYLARSQGVSLMLKIQQELAAGRMPAEELIDGAMVLSGGLLLLTPGFCTDLTGFLLLAPFSRTVLKGWLKKLIGSMVAKGEIKIYQNAVK